MIFHLFFLLLVLLPMQRIRRLLGLDDGTIRGELVGFFAFTASSCHVLLFSCCCLNLVDCCVDSDAVPGSNDNVGLQTALGMLLLLLLLLLLLFLGSYALARMKKNEK